MVFTKHIRTYWIILSNDIELVNSRDLAATMMGLQRNRAWSVSINNTEPTDLGQFKT